MSDVGLRLVDDQFRYRPSLVPNSLVSPAVRAPLRVLHEAPESTLWRFPCPEGLCLRRFRSERRARNHVKKAHPSVVLERFERVAQAFHEGRPDCEAAALTGLSVRRVARIRYRLGLVRPHTWAAAWKQSKAAHWRRAEYRILRHLVRRRPGIASGALYEAYQGVRQQQGRVPSKQVAFWQLLQNARREHALVGVGTRKGGRHTTLWSLPS